MKVTLNRTSPARLSGRMVFAVGLYSVPPKLILSYENATLTNASYQKDHGYETHYLENSTYVAAKKAINVKCLAEGAKPKANITWTINGEVVHDVPPQETYPNLKENRTFDSISTLQFSPIGEQVTVTCNVSLDGTDIEASASATFSTYVEPRVFFLLNGNMVYAEEVYVQEDDTINLTCSAIGSRPAANLTLEGYYNSLEPSSHQTHDANNATFDSYLSLVMSPKSDTGIITCSTYIVGITGRQKITLGINTYVLREPSITFNGQSHDIIRVNQNNSVTLICNAAGSRPRAILTWTVNGLLPQEPTHKVSKSSELSSLIFQPKHDDLVECHSFLLGPNITRVANVTFLSYGGSFDYIITVIVPCAAAVLTVLIIFCIYCAIRRFKGSSQSTNFPTNMDIPLEKTSDIPLRKTPQKEYVEDTNIVHTKPPDLELPEVPTDSERPYYSELPEQENAYELNFHTEYYSAMGKSGAHGQMFPEKDICFILNMKMGHIYDRWMGTIDVNPFDKKCVILSTVSDSIRKKDIQWDKFVKRVLQLPDATNLTKVEGIGIYEGKLYLIHEHMACETLEDRISDQISRTEVMGHLIGILEGLEVIQSLGLLHPGLSTRKVLLTKQRICKLYDFCLTEDASYTVRIRKSRITCTLNQLAPEALLRDKYSEMSDVWSVAVIIWEILSCGTSPFPNEEQSPDSEKAVYSLPETWPTNYKLLRNKRLFDCWNQDTSLRPTISKLKSSFIENFEALDTYGPSNTSTDGLASSYVHMKGIKDPEDKDDS